MQPITYESERDFIDLMRRLWKGETIKDYDGVLGQYPVLSVAEYLDEALPILSGPAQPLVEPTRE